MLLNYRKKCRVWVVRQRALATADGSSAAGSASTHASVADLVGKASSHVSRWFVGVAKTVFGFVLARAICAMGANVEVREGTMVRVTGVDGVRRAVRASAERPQSVAAHDA